MIKIAAMVGAPDLRQETLAVYSGDLDIAIPKLARLGYDGIEIMTRNPKSLDMAGIKRLLADNQLTLAGFCTGHVYGEDTLGLVDPDPAVCRMAMARLKDFIDIAAGHAGPGTWVNIGRVRGNGIPGNLPATLQRAEAAFRELADYALPYGVRVVLEPANAHQVTFIRTTQDGIDMAQRVGRPNFGLMLDVYHMNIEDVSIYDSFRQAHNLCWAIHFSDNNRQWPGSAHLNFRQIVRVLNDIGYAGFVSLEILPLPDPDTAARSSIGFLRKYIPRA